MFLLMAVNTVNTRILACSGLSVSGAREERRPPPSPCYFFVRSLRSCRLFSRAPLTESLEQATYENWLIKHHLYKNKFSLKNKTGSYIK